MTLTAPVGKLTPGTKVTFTAGPSKGDTGYALKNWLGEALFEIDGSPSGAGFYLTADDEIEIIQAG